MVQLTSDCLCGVRRAKPLNIFTLFEEGEITIQKRLALNIFTLFEEGEITIQKRLAVN